MATSGKSDRRAAMVASLEAFVAGEEGLAREAVRVRGLEPLGGGASRLLFSLDVEIDDAETGTRSLELVLRQDPPGRTVPGGMELEFALIQAAGEAGVPVPRVYWCSGDGAALGSPFFVMERLAGEAIPRRLLRDERYEKAREEMTGELGAILARIHAIDLDASGLRGRMPAPDPSRPSGALEIQRLREGLRGFAVEPHPVLDLAERWLAERVPAAREPVLVHGDFRIGNVLFDESGTRAVLDWELSHLGDPAEDLGWFCVRAWRFGNDARAAGGIGSREELVEAYEAAGGEPVDPERLRFWEVAGNLKLALVFVTQARVYLDGHHRTVELASLGRRIAEAEDELLRLMEGEA